MLSLLPIIIFLVIIGMDKKKKTKKKKSQRKVIKEHSDFDQFVDLIKHEWKNAKQENNEKTLSQALHDRGILRKQDGSSLDKHPQNMEKQWMTEHLEVKGKISDAIDNRRKDVRLAREKYHRDFLGEEENINGEEETFAYEIIDLEEKNPWVEGIILSEILGKPKAMRK